MKPMTSLTTTEKRILVAEFVGETMVGLKKRGMWYRPDACGYTSSEAEAGRFTTEEAKKHEYKPAGFEEEWVTIHRFSGPDIDDLSYVVKACERLESQTTFARNLARVVSPNENNEFRSDLQWHLAARWINATASQRTDALLLTIGKAVL
jgi:hypothetical protein